MKKKSNSGFPCDEDAVEYTASAEKPYHFVNSGLDNVYLVGVKYFVRRDEQSAEIPALEHLMTAIAKALVSKSGGLTGPECRFLRKRLSKKSIDFAPLMSVTPQQLSALESGSIVQPGRDKLIRMIYKVLTGEFTASLRDPENFTKWLASIHKSGGSERIVATWQRNHQWKVESETIAA